MQKSYILKFNKTQGDYVIVEEEKNLEKQKPQEARGLFFNRNFFKNFKKTQENQEKTQNLQQNQEINFLENLDKGLEKEKKDRQKLKEDLTTVQENQEPVQNNPTSPPTQNQPTQPTQPQPVQPTPTQPTPQPTRPNNSVNINETIELLCQLYNKFRVLNMIYQVLRDTSQASAENFSDFINQNVALQGGVLNIYSAVSGQNSPPRSDEIMPMLSSEFDEILEIASNYIQEMREINLKLSRSFSVENFNRQFNLIENSLSVQNDFLTGLRVQSLCQKIQ